MATVDVFANQPQTVITSGGTTAPAPGTSESWTPAAPAGFPTASPVASPATVFRVIDPALPTEKIIVTDSRTTPWTVTRGAEGTSPVAHAAGFTAEHVITAAALGNLPYAQLDATAADIQTAGNQAAGTVGKGADSGHVHPASLWIPQDNGLQIANFDPATIGNGVAPAAGVLYLMKLPIRQAPSPALSKLWFQVGGAGSGASTGTFVGLYSSAGVLLTGSADAGAAFSSPGVPSIALTTPQAPAAGTFVWAAFLANLATAQPFLPQAYGANTAFLNAGLTAATAQFAKFGSGLTTLPASFTPSALTVPGFAWWVGAS